MNEEQQSSGWLAPPARVYAWDDEVPAAVFELDRAGAICGFNLRGLGWQAQRQT